MSKLIRALIENARNTPDKTAINGSQAALTWHELHAETIAMAERLEGVSTLGMLMENSPAWVITDLSAIQAGIVNVPLPGFFSDEQLLHAIQDAQIDTVITDNPARLGALLPASSETRLEIAGRQYVQMSFPVSGADRKQKTTAKVTYTSGTTGSPRGVQLPLSAIETVAASLAEAAGAISEDRALVLLPLAILLENIGSVYVPLLAGAEIVVPDPADLGLSGSSKIDAGVFAAALQRIRPSAMILPPQLLKLLVGLAEQQVLPDSFRFIAVGGAPVGVTLLDAARQLELPIFQGYGLSEACSVVTLNTPGHNRMGSAGRPLSHNKLRVNEQGEIVILGESHNGYLNEAGRHPAEELPTGDLGYLDEDGYLYVTGRSRDRIITGYGRNVSPEWVESELQSHPLIAQATVFGNDMPYMVAVLVLSQYNQHNVDRDVLDSVLREANARLPDYARVRDYVIADAPFSIESGELSAGGNPCRAAIEQHYAGQIENQLEVQNEQLL